MLDCVGLCWLIGYWIGLDWIGKPKSKSAKFDSVSAMRCDGMAWPLQRLLQALQQRRVGVQSPDTPGVGFGGSAAAVGEGPGRGTAAHEGVANWDQWLGVGHDFRRGQVSGLFCGGLRWIVLCWI